MQLGSSIVVAVVLASSYSSSSTPSLGTSICHRCSPKKIEKKKKKKKSVRARLPGKDKMTPGETFDSLQSSQAEGVRAVHTRGRV